MVPPQPNFGNARAFARSVLTIALALSLAAPEVRSIVVDGVERRALVYAPATRKSAPLVFAFHGHGGNMRQAARSFRLHEHWPEAVVVYPQGLPTSTLNDPEGRRPGWQNLPRRHGDRDLKFVDALLEDLAKNDAIDTKRVYAMGHSNGGRFCYVLWSERAPRFAAFAPSGAHAAGLHDKLTPKSAFLIGGMADALVPFANQQATARRLETLLRVDPASVKTSGDLRSYVAADGLRYATYFHAGGHEYPASGGRMVADFFKELATPGLAGPGRQAIDQR